MRERLSIDHQTTAESSGSSSISIAGSSPRFHGIRHNQRQAKTDQAYARHDVRLDLGPPSCVTKQNEGFRLSVALLDVGEWQAGDGASLVFRNPRHHGSNPEEPR